MKKIRLKLQFDELDTIMKLVNEQVITEFKPANNYQKMLIALLAEWYAKHYQKTCFAYAGVRVVNFTVAQAFAFMEAVQEGWFKTSNNWTKTILLTYNTRLHQQTLA